ncbi:unnamed protein product [Orchesella dallaii]|uniref:C2H2-type domain-containing protein n=1 Tax=Orchesella dallaii TaxID=48710 RepID=A0ABP1QU25_9HEXA
MDVAIKCCIICGQPRLKSEPQSLIGITEPLPGSDGSTLLNDQLCVYFIARKLLKLSRSRCIQFVSHFQNITHTSSWFQTLCSGCGDIVVQALGLHRTLVALAGQVEELGKTLQLMVQNSIQATDLPKSEDDGDAVWLEIRKLLEADNVPHGVSLIEEVLQSQDVHGRQCSDNDFDTGWNGGEDCYSDFENVNEKTIQSSKKGGPRKKNKVSYKNSSDSDSEYEPDRRKPKRQKSLNKRGWNANHCTKTDSGYQCRSCESFYTTSHGFKNHIRVHEESKKLGGRFDCPKCNHPNLSEEKLRRHLTKIHETVKNTCSVCGYVAHRRWLHEKHMLEQHNIKLWTPLAEREEKQGNISENGFVQGNSGLSDTGNGNETLADVNKSRSVECKSEGISLNDGDTNRSCLNSLAREFASKSNLLKLAANRSSVGISCRLCKSVYKTFGGFRRHVDDHNESKSRFKNKFDCPKCNHPNLSEEKLRRHLTKVHETVKNTCSICGKVSQRRGHHEKHMLKKHKIKIWTPISEKQSIKMEIDTKASSNETTDADNLQSRNNAAEMLSVDESSLPENAVVDKTEARRKRRRIKNLSNLKVDSDVSAEEDNDGGKVGRRRKSDDEWSGAGEASGMEEDCGSSNDGSDEDFTLKSARKPSGGSELYTCKICKSVYKSHRGYHRHQQEHRISKELNHKYDCEICSFPNSCERKLRYHKKRAHQEIVMIKCSICSYEALRPKQLRLHMKQHNPSYKRGIHTGRPRKKLRSANFRSDGKIECEICKAQYSGPEGYSRHLKDHEESNANNNQFDCDVCKFPCSSESRLRRHKSLKHVKTFPTCHLCGQTFIRPNLLRSHLKFHEENDKELDQTTGEYVCRFCKESFPSMRGLQTHKLVIHQTEMAASGKCYLCSNCGQCFSTVALLRRHVKTKHENIHRFTCETCGKGFESKHAIESHKIIHNLDRKQEFVCEVCGVAYSHKRSLEQHKVKFHPDAVGRKVYSKLAKGPAKEGHYKCKWCEVVFPFKYALVRHIPVAHKDLYNFNCDVCGKAYISSSSLRLHKEITHADGTTKYSCEYCGKLFPHKHYVVCHYKWCRKKQGKQDSLKSTSKPMESGPKPGDSNSYESTPESVQPSTSTDTSQQFQWKTEGLSSLSSLSSSFYFANNMYPK